MKISTNQIEVYIKRTISVVLLIILFLCSVEYYNNLSYNSYDKQVYYNKIPSDVVDIALIGSSHLFCGINPVQLWKDYGVAAYLFSSGSQAMWYSYVNLVDMLRKSHPELVVLDTYIMTDLDDDYYDSQVVEMNLAGLYPSLEKLKVLTKTKSEEKPDIWLNYPIYHNRYSKLSARNYLEVDEKEYTGVLGVDMSSKVYAYADSIYVPDSNVEVSSCSKKEEMYLRKCIELCQSKGIPVLLTHTPTYRYNEDWHHIMNYIEGIANEYGVEFVNGCLFIDEIGIDYSTDNKDESGHLNASGISKYTKWLYEKYIVKYNVVTHVDEVNVTESNEKDKYYIWNKSAINQEATKIQDLLFENSKLTYEEVISILMKSNYWTFVAVDEGNLLYYSKGEQRVKHSYNEEYKEVWLDIPEALTISGDGIHTNISYGYEDVVKIDAWDTDKPQRAIWAYCDALGVAMRTMYFGDDGYVVFEEGLN